MKEMLLYFDNNIVVALGINYIMTMNYISYLEFNVSSFLINETIEQNREYSYKNITFHILFYRFTSIKFNVIGYLLDSNDCEMLQAPPLYSKYLELAIASEHVLDCCVSLLH